MRIIIYLKDGTVRHDAMICQIIEGDNVFITKDIWGDTIKYDKEKVALITVQN